jgi:hypothetical protein
MISILRSSDFDVNTYGLGAGLLDLKKDFFFLHCREKGIQSGPNFPNETI